MFVSKLSATFVVNTNKFNPKVMSLFYRILAMLTACKLVVYGPTTEPKQIVSQE